MYKPKRPYTRKEPVLTTYADLLAYNLKLLLENDGIKSQYYRARRTIYFIMPGDSETSYRVVYEKQFQKVHLAVKPKELPEAVLFQAYPEIIDINNPACNPEPLAIELHNVVKRIHYGIEAIIIEWKKELGEANSKAQERFNKLVIESHGRVIRNG